MFLSFIKKSITFVLQLLTWQCTYRSSTFEESWVIRINVKELLHGQPIRLLMEKKDGENEEKYTHLKETITNLSNENGNVFGGLLSAIANDDKFRKEFKSFMKEETLREQSDTVESSNNLDERANPSECVDNIEKLPDHVKNKDISQEVFDTSENDDTDDNIVHNEDNIDDNQDDDNDNVNDDDDDTVNADDDNDNDDDTVNADDDNDNGDDTVNADDNNDDGDDDDVDNDDDDNDDDDNDDADDDCDNEKGKRIEKGTEKERGKKTEKGTEKEKKKRKGKGKEKEKEHLKEKKLNDNLGEQQNMEEAFIFDYLNPKLKKKKKKKSKIFRFIKRIDLYIKKELSRIMDDENTKNPYYYIKKQSFFQKLFYTIDKYRIFSPLVIIAILLITMICLSSLSLVSSPIGLGFMWFSVPLLALIELNMGMYYSWKLVFMKIFNKKLSFSKNKKKPRKKLIF
ncbi:Plasmodium exported protein, unknown function [Plasmodium ovale]|uniref:Fam-b protein n=1 Tax=Plasmodium ovale TaxID=36330 RepID=A0A1D3JEJ0_PLAOA|nr:Plasmodium exported protein, unknown function [Plasmodium ovale]